MLRELYHCPFTARSNSRHGSLHAMYVLQCAVSESTSLLMSALHTHCLTPLCKSSAMPGCIGAVISMCILLCLGL